MDPKSRKTGIILEAVEILDYNKYKALIKELSYK